MNPKSEKPRFFSGIAKKAADIAGVQFVNVQPQTPKQEFATSPTVAQDAPVFGEVKTTPMEPSPSPVSLGEKAVSSVPPVPDMQPASALGVVPAVPEAPKPPVPDTIQSAFQNAPESTLNPTIIPASEDVSATDSKPAVDAPPVIVPAEPAQEAQNTVVPDEPKTPEEPLVNNPQEPVVVSPSMATPEIVPSDHIVEEPVVDSEIKKEETAGLPSAVENTFEDKPADHLDPKNSNDALGTFDLQEEASDVPEDPVVTDILLSDPAKYISKDGIINMGEVRAAKFAKEVMKNPTAANLFKQLQSLGVTREDAVEKLLEPFIK